MDPTLLVALMLGHIGAFALTKLFLHDHAWNCMSAAILRIAYFVGTDRPEHWCIYYVVYLVVDLALHHNRPFDPSFIAHHVVALLSYVYLITATDTGTNILFGIFMVESSTVLLNLRNILKTHGWRSLWFDLLAAAVYIAERGVRLPLFLYQTLVGLQDSASFRWAVLLAVAVQTINYVWIGKIIYISAQKAAAHKNKLTHNNRLARKNGLAHKNV